MNLDFLENSSYKEHPTYRGYYGNREGKIISFHKPYGNGIVLQKPKVLSGKLNKCGYRVYNLKLLSGKYITVKGHRFIWECFNGLTSVQLDHIDRNPSNNSLSNLRFATNIQNQRNTIKPRWVRYSKARRQYLVQPSVNGKRVFIGWFKSELDARKAFVKFYYELDPVFYFHLKDEYQRSSEITVDTEQ